jgi:hypothetical protein
MADRGDRLDRVVSRLIVICVLIALTALIW